MDHGEFEAIVGGFKRLKTQGGYTISLEVDEGQADEVFALAKHGEKVVTVSWKAQPTTVYGGSDGVEG